MRIGVNMMKSSSNEEQILAKYNDNMRRNDNAIMGIEKRKRELEDKVEFLFECRRQLGFYLENSRNAHAGTSEYYLIDQLDMETHEEEIKLRRLYDEVREELEKEEEELYEQQEEIKRKYREEINAYYNKGVS